MGMSDEREIKLNSSGFNLISADQAASLNLKTGE